MARRFNQSQRIALFLATGGKCSICGSDLESDWHADHVYPWSEGGATDVINGQALCPSCNLIKGKKKMLQNWTRPLRKWQEEAYADYQQHIHKNFLLVATPGAGKTNFALRVAHYLLQSNIVTQIIVVCPTEHLKKQWAREAAQVGIQLDPDYSPANAAIKSGFNGIATTYQQVSGISKDLFRFLCKKPTCVFFDEIHHAGESLAWGDALKEAFEPAIRRIALSGTPFRGDNNRIPFVEYDDEGRCVADSPYGYSYGYGDSLRDEVCRFVFFPKYEGRMEWFSGESGKIRSATFDDELTQREASERLSTAISANGEWIKQVIQDAHKRLLDLRSNGHSNAGGLVIAKDQNHAQSIANLLKELTGEVPVLAISDNPDASHHIEKFRKSSGCWIVAVKMVSEGVDIPRLRVLVYATNIATELFFRQAVGRIIRVIPGLEEQNAFFFIPDEKTLKAFAQLIKEERQHQLEQEEAEVAEYEDEYEDKGEVVKIPSPFRPISSEAEPDGAIFDQSEYTEDELNTAALAGQQSGHPFLAREVIAYFMRLGSRVGQQGNNIPAKPPEEQTPLYKRLEQQRRIIKVLVGHYAAISGKEHKQIHNEWMRQGGQPQAKATLEELKRKQVWLEELINRV